MSIRDFFHIGGMKLEEQVLMLFLYFGAGFVFHAVTNIFEGMNWRSRYINLSGFEDLCSH